MEIALLPKMALKIKGKQATFVVNPQDVTAANALLFLEDTLPQIKEEDSVVINGAGEYEIGGTKITALRSDKNILYSLSVDGIDILVGKLDHLAAMQHKLKEHAIVIGLCDGSTNASFLTALAVNVIMFYGEKATEIAQGFEKENLKQTNKYTIVSGKLPAEVETILLS